MPKRPSFQFYPADWRNNAKLRRCSEAARGAWIDIMCVLHDSDEYGVLRWPLADVARAAGVPLKLARELVANGVLKGGGNGCDPFIYRPRSGNRVGNSVILVDCLSGPCWYSSRMVRDEYVRQNRGNSAHFTKDSKHKKPSPKPPFGEPESDGSTSSSTSSVINLTVNKTHGSSTDEPTPQTTLFDTPKKPAKNTRKLQETPGFKAAWAEYPRKTKNRKALSYGTSWAWKTSPRKF